jgi:lipoyl(octanoyl) transferase
MMRLIHDGAADGPTNMARDEAMLIAVGNKSAPPTLRLYQWSPPTISLGYFQKFADYEALPAPAGALPVVRRLTGGGAILHDLELTYSMALPVGHELLVDGPSRLYELAHDAVIAALGELDVAAARCGKTDDSGAARGPFFCFERRHCYDVLLGGDKIAGSAQRRTRQAVLQHGSIVLGNRFAQQSTAVGWKAQDLDKTPALIAAARNAYTEQMKTVLGVHFESMSWSESERELAAKLREKYLADYWTRRT